MSAGPLVVVPLDVLQAMIREELERDRRERVVPIEGDAWLDAKGAGEVLGVHARTVTRLVAREGLPAHRVGPKLWRFRRSELLAWLDRRSR